MSIRIGIGLDNFASAGIDANAQTIFNRIIADGGVSNLTRLNFFIKGLKAIYGDLANVPVCYDAHWIGYKLGSGTGATAGQAAAKLYSLTVAGDAVQTTAASQPLLLSHNGASSDNYWYGSGVSGNNVSTPNASAQTLVNEFELKGYVNTRNLITYGVLANKQSGNGYQFYLRSTGVLGIYAPGIASSIESTVGLTLNTDIYFKINRAAGSSNFIFYSSTDGITYTQLGATVVVNSSNFTTSTQPFIVGGDGASGGFLGRIYRLTLATSIGGAPVVDFNPAQYNASTSQTAWTSSTGEVWTINESTGATYHGALVDRTIVMGDGIDDKLISSSPIVAQPDTIYTSFKCNYSGANTPTIYESSFLNRQFFTRSNNTLINSFAGSFLTKTANVKSLNLITNLHNGLNSDVQQNNGASTIGNMGLNSLEGLNLLGNPANAPTVFSPAIINTLIVTSLNDSLTTRTATYNLIRSLNNNAF